MTDVRSYTPFSQLVSELKILCLEGRTGTAYIVTDDNKMARLGLEAGEIDFILFQRKRGADALAMMQHIQAGRLRFEDGLKPSADATDLPATTDILEFLNNPQSKGAPQALAPQAAQNTQTLNAADRAMVEAVLTDYIGPMASIICDEQLNEVSNLESALKALAAEIQDSGQIKEFLDRVHAQLGKA
jgi:hypothetical protein